MDEIRNQEWNYNPKIPIENNPLFSFPFLPKKIIKKHGAVSVQCCLSMVNNLSKISKSKLCISGDLKSATTDFFPRFKPFQ